MMNVLGVIPARFGSQRFPGKPLAPLGDKTLIQQTYENALRCALFSEIIVATDDGRIFDHVMEFGGNVVMTPVDCPTGSDRIVNVLEQKTQLISQYPLVVNIQGDEPYVSSDSFSKLILALRDSDDAVMSTLVTPLNDMVRVMQPSQVKCVRDLNGYALYFSRSLIPSAKGGGWNSSATYFGHIGVYAYRTEFLMKYNSLPSTPLQLAEDLEQLKVLEHGYRIITAVVDEVTIGVDTPEDLKHLEKLICTANIYSLQAASVPR